MNLLQVDNSTGFSSVIVDSQSIQQQVFHQRIPQGKTFPAVVYDVIASSPAYAKGAIKADTYSVVFSVYHKNDYEASVIAEQLRNVLEGWSGEFGGKVWHYTVLERTAESFDNTLDLYIASIDFVFSKVA